MKKTQSQKKRLLKLIQYLFNNNEFYRSVLKDISFLNEDNVIDYYNKITPISKDLILENYAQCLDKDFLDLFENQEQMEKIVFDVSNLSENHDKYIEVSGTSWFVENTSGTTGKPFPVIKSHSEMMLEAIQLSKCRNSVCKGATVENGFLLVHKVDEYLKGLNILTDDSILGDVLDYMLEKQPKWLFATSFLLNRLVKYIKASNKKYNFESLNLMFIETTSQKLLDEEQKEIEDIFGCKVVNNYGSREVWNIAYEEKADGKLYVNNHTLMVDLIDDENNIIEEEGVVGDVIVTSLVHKTMPIFKYYLGDRARFYYDQQGRAYFVLEEGRRNEKLVGTPYYGSAIFRKVLRKIYFNNDISYIRKIRIIQESENKIVVYLDSDKRNDEFFEKKFVELFYKRIKNLKEFEFWFVYDYPFEVTRASYKDKIFETKC